MPSAATQPSVARLHSVRRLLQGFGPRAGLALCLVLPTVAAVQLLLLDALGRPRLFDGVPYTHLNNFMIFRASFWHLVGGLDLYQLYPSEHFDLFKYSPTFALFMAPWAVVPPAIGLIGWNLLNGLTLWAGLRRLTSVAPQRLGLMALFLAPEILTSSQNTQTNLLIAGLLLLAFSWLERGHVELAALAIVATAYIKLFGGAALVLGFMYPRRVRFAASAAASGVVLGLAPLLVVSVSQLGALYQSWFELLRADHAAVLGASVFGLVKAFFGIELPKLAAVGVAAGLSFVPALKPSVGRDELKRRLVVCVVLLWVIIFNHRAESATYVVAMCGVALWAFSQVEATRLTKWLAGFALVLTSLSATDVFPSVVRQQVIAPYALKALPCVIIWALLVVQLWRGPVRTPTGVGAA